MGVKKEFYMVYKCLQCEKIEDPWGDRCTPEDYLCFDCAWAKALEESTRKCNVSGWIKNLADR